MGTMQAGIRLINNKIKFSSAVSGKPEIITDSKPPYGDGDGYYPTELLLISFGTCAGGTVLSLLRRFGRTVDGVEIQMYGSVREEHPKCFSRIDMEMAIASPDATADDCKTALMLTEKKYCPVWAMLRGNVETKTLCKLNGETVETHG